RILNHDLLLRCHCGSHGGSELQCSKGQLEKLLWIYVGARLIYYHLSGMKIALRQAGCLDCEIYYYLTVKILLCKPELLDYRQQFLPEPERVSSKQQALHVFHGRARIMMPESAQFLADPVVVPLLKKIEPQVHVTGVVEFLVKSIQCLVSSEQGSTGLPNQIHEGKQAINNYVRPRQDDVLPESSSSQEVVIRQTNGSPEFIDVVFISGDQRDCGIAFQDLFCFLQH